MVQLQELPRVLRPKVEETLPDEVIAEDTVKLKKDPEVEEVPRPEDTGDGCHPRESEVIPRVEERLEGAELLKDDVDSDGDEFFDSISLNEEFPDEGADDVNDCLGDVSGLDELRDQQTQAMLSTPIQKLEIEYERCMRLNAEELDLEPAVYIHEGSDLLAQLRDQLAMLPELQELSPTCDIDAADVGDSETTSPLEEQKLRSILKYHRSIFLGDGNAAPAPARGVICDLDVGTAKPVAQRARSIPPHLAIKVYELLKKRLETG
ncbi:hypothetical protein PRIC2_004599 [Phytophthora ramorum]